MHILMARGMGNVLQAAAFNGNKETLRVILDAGANIFAEVTMKVH
jgi:hypothetical protein